MFKFLIYLSYCLLSFALACNIHAQQYSIAATLRNRAAIEIVPGTCVCRCVYLNSCELHMPTSHTRVINKLLVNVEYALQGV